MQLWSLPDKTWSWFNSIFANSVILTNITTFVFFRQVVSIKYWFVTTHKVESKVIFLHLSVILFTGGVPGQVHPLGPGTHHPWDQVHPSATRYTPWTRYTPCDQVHPLGTRYTPRLGTHPIGTDTPLAGTLPRQGTPPGLDTPPWDKVHPPGHLHPPGNRYTPWQVHLWDQVQPPDQVHLPRPGIPPRPGTPPRTRYTPQGTRYTTPKAVHAGRYGQQVGGTHPTGMHSCFVSYLQWNFTLISLKLFNCGKLQGKD